MSFWKSFGFHTVSAIDTLLDSGEYTLEQLLEEEEILQETKSQNRKLIDFLIQPESLRKLLFYITVEPEKPETDEDDSKRRFKYPFLACEILGSEVWAICDAFFDQTDLLEDLFSYFEKEAPLNPLLASYTSRVAIVLLQKKTLETVAFLRNRKDIIFTFLKHVGNASVMDLLLKIIASETQAEGVGVLEWLCTTDLIPSLIKKFDPQESRDVHENAGQVLCDIIMVSADVPSSPLIAQLESEESLTTLFQYILAKGLSSGLFYGLSTLIELMKRHLNRDYEYQKILEDLPPIFRIIVSHIEQLHSLLLPQQQEEESKEETGEKVELTVGKVEPLGFNRLKIVEFLMILVRTNYSCMDAELMKRNVLETCLDLFFKYQWNNFLHTIVEQMVVSILEGQNVQMKLYLLSEAKLIDKICAGSAANEESLKQAKPVRKGYMGHMTCISTCITNVAQGSSEVEKFLADHKAWNEYVNDSLAKTIELENTIIGGYMPTDLTGEEDDLDDFDGEGFGTEESFRFDDDEDEDDDEEGDEEGMYVEDAILEEEEEPVEAEIVVTAEEWEEKTIEDPLESTDMKSSELNEAKEDEKEEEDDKKEERKEDDKKEEKKEEEEEEEEEEVVEKEKAVTITKDKTNVMTQSSQPNVMEDIKEDAESVKEQQQHPTEVKFIIQLSTYSYSKEQARKHHGLIII